MPLTDQIVSRSKTALQLVLAAVAMVLLIACVNITNLLLARGGRRQREFAIRRASGADHVRPRRRGDRRPHRAATLAGQNPLGKRFRHGEDDSPWVEVVGVVNDVGAVSLTDDPPLSIYRPVGDYFYGLAALAVKTASDPAAVASAIQTILRQMDPNLVVPAPRTMDEIVAASVAQPRFQMNVMVLLAAAAVFLAALGIYGVVSQSVMQRAAEFGVRMALGAASASILGLVLRRAILPVLVGLGAGVAASIGVSGFLRALLFGVYRPMEWLSERQACFW